MGSATATTTTITTAFLSTSEVECCLRRAGYSQAHLSSESLRDVMLGLGCNHEGQVDEVHDDDDDACPRPSPPPAALFKPTMAPCSWLHGIT